MLSNLLHVCKSTFLFMSMWKAIRKRKPVVQVKSRFVQRCFLTKGSKTRQTKAHNIEDTDNDLYNVITLNEPVDKDIL